MISSAALAMLDRWIAVRHALGFGREVPLFCTLDGKRMSYPAADAMFKRRARKAHGEDTGPSWRLHGLRHSRAIELERKGEPVSIICTFLGQAEVEVTCVYLNGLRRMQEVAVAGDDDWSL